jgi:Fe-S-cluster-containing hydrogenase component 2
MTMTDHFFIKTNFDLCTGCSLCQLACSMRLLGGYNPHRALLKIAHASENLYHFPTVCNQCANPYCANVCPVQAIHRDSATGAMVVDHEQCVGCNLCHQYCPIGVVGVDPDLKKSVKCDLCQGDPHCVAACPTGALELCVRKEVQHG